MSGDFGSSFEEQGIPDHLQPLPAEDEIGDPLEGVVTPRDEPVAADDYGTTVAEQRERESLDERLAREEPDVSPDDAAILDERDAVPGRLLAEEDVEVGVLDTVAEETALETDDRAGLSAEEAAMHIEEGL